LNETTQIFIIMHPKKTTFSIDSWILALCLLALACDKADPCESKTCLNGGTCNEGTCQCTERWTGEDCGAQKTPTLLKISQIQVNKYPEKNASNGNWDASDGPDLYLKLVKGTTLVWTGPVFPLPLNPPAGQSPVFTLATNNQPELTSPTEEYILELWDKDTAPDADDFMGGIKFKAYSSTNKFPENLRVECSTCNTGYILALKYVF
jgi:hypothetical protein